MLLARITTVVILLTALLPLGVRALTALAYRDRVYNAETAPARSAAIVLGARVYGSGRPSAMLADRIATGADLYHAGKVDLLIMSGDGASIYYNEPEAMRRYALELGVPDEAIVLDYAGFRTYDSCYRARHVFHIADAIVVTQNFHVDRALMTCRWLGIDAVGVFADYQRPWGYSRASLTYSRVREVPATLVAILDLIRREPAQVMEVTPPPAG